MQAIPVQDDDPHLLLPADDVEDPEVTVLVPTLNEEQTIGRFMEWCREGIAKAGVAIEVLIVDSSTDTTPDIALAHGARVLRAPKRGLGRAYIDAVPFVRGKFVIMGDADCTYDFRELVPFIDAYRAGAEFVMGSRFRGSIEKNAMPKLHQYFGTPVTTWILNLLMGSRISDIHCGMRGIRRDALVRMDLHSQGWQYASEMILKAVHMKLETAEVPISFLKEPEGRESHMKRRGFLEPWRAGWQNLEAMFTFGLDFFLFKPGILLTAVCVPLILLLAWQPIDLHVVRLSTNTMLIALCGSVLGVSMLQSALLARLLFDYTGRLADRYKRMLPYNRVFVCATLGVILGLLLIEPLVSLFLAHRMELPGIGRQTRWAVLGLWLIIVSFQTFIFVLMIRAMATMLPNRALAAAASTAEEAAASERPSADGADGADGGAPR